MDLKQYLSGKSKVPIGCTEEWLPFCLLAVPSGSLWMGNPQATSAENGCVVRVSRGNYLVEAIGLSYRCIRVVSRLRARLQGVASPEVGDEVATFTIDRPFVGICDSKSFGGSSAKKPSTGIPSVPTGVGGQGPVFALTSAGRRVGIEVEFMDELTWLLQWGTGCRLRDGEWLPPKKTKVGA